MEISGTIKKIFDIQFFPSGFKKREIILTTNDQYPQYLSIEFIQDKVDLLNDLEIGDLVKIFINLKGREWINPEGIVKYFNTIQGWRIEKTKFQTIENKSSLSLSDDLNNHQIPDIKRENSLEEFDDLPF